MPEGARSLRWILLPAAAMFMLATAVAGPWVLPCAWLGATLAAVALAEREQLRAVAQAAAMRWLAGMALAGALLAWPLSRFLAEGGFGAWLWTWAMGGVVLLLAWWQWPAWARVLGGRPPSVHSGAGAADWRGLGIAAPVTVVCIAAVLLAWPGAIPPPWRWGLAALLALGVAVSAWRRLGKVASAVPAIRQPPRPARNAEAVDWDTAMAGPDPTAGEDPASAAPIGAVALYEAARRGRAEHALRLLAAGADAHAPPPADDRDRRSLAQLAAVLPDLRLLRALIEAGVALEAPPGQPTALIAATRDSWHGRPEAVMTLLANGANPQARDGDGNTPLHHAARSTDPGVVALLLDASAEIDALNDEGRSPLALACRNGNWRLARFLVEKGAGLHPEGGEPALVAAAATEDDDPAGVGFLLRQKAVVDARGRDGRTALQQAAAAGHMDILEALLEARADVRTRDEAGLDSWLLAAGNGDLPMLQRLAEAGADPRATDAQGRDALMRALAETRATPALAEWLRETGRDADLRDAEGRTAIEQAMAQGRWALVAALDPGRPLPADPDEATPRPPSQLLLDALETGDHAAMAGLAALLDAREEGSVLLEAARRHPARIRELLPLIQAREPRGPDGDTPFFLLLDRAAADAVAREALRALSSAGVSPAGAGGLARYLAGAVQARIGADAADAERLALALLDAGADGHGAHHGDSPLGLAVRLGWMRLTEALIDRGADPTRPDARGMAPLHLAAAFDRGRAIPRLLMAGAQPAARSSDGQSALGVALANGRVDMARWLDWRGTQHPGRHLRAADLPATAVVGDADGVRRLLALGFDVDSRDAQGCTALLRAAGGGHLDALDALLEAGADPDLAASGGATPLSAAVSTHNPGAIDRLLAAGARLDRSLADGVSVLMLACALGLPDVAGRLIAAGVDVGQGDEAGMQPLHGAALYGFGSRDRARLLALFDTLLLAGADADTATALGLTPLLMLLGARAQPGAECDEGVLAAGIERLLDEEVSLSARDARGFGPLHLAALHGLGDLVRMLLRAGADPAQRDHLNRTPRDIAVMRGYLDVAAAFDPGAGAPSTARMLHRPAG